MIDLFEPMRLLVDDVAGRVVTVVEEPRHNRITGKIKIVLLNARTQVVSTEYYTSSVELFERFSRFGSSPQPFK